MIEKEIEIRTADGTADGVLFQPEQGRRYPGVIHLTDIGGIRPSHREMAKRLSASGYTVLLPNVFYRTGKPPMFDFVPKMGDEKTMKRFGELAGPMTPQAMWTSSRQATPLTRAKWPWSVTASPAGWRCAPPR